ncbi:MAG: cytidine deaminase [Peptostreptococcaceae bacterium]|nr:cytidine deaminase [Peptostreptococcaceae bacterium]
MKLDHQFLVKQALEAREMSYCPYSDFAVGAALLSKDGKIYKGCNIESASYSPTNCAERTAVFKAVSEGVREFSAIAVVGGKQGILPQDYAWPCGVCRQVLIEFCDPDEFIVIVGKDENEYQVFTLGELLPQGFSPKNLKK